MIIPIKRGEILTQEERALIEEEAMAIARLHEDFKVPAESLILDLALDPDPPRYLYEERLLALYEGCHREAGK